MRLLLLKRDQGEAKVNDYIYAPGEIQIFQGITVLGGHIGIIVDLEKQSCVYYNISLFINYSQKLLVGSRVTRDGHFEPFYSVNWHFWESFRPFSSGYSSQLGIPKVDILSYFIQ